MSLHALLHPLASGRGQSMVEFALVGPLFFAVVIVIMEGGLLMNAQASLDNAAREGVREAIVCPNDQPSALIADCYGPVKSAVDSHLGIIDPTREAFAVCIPDTTPPATYLAACPTSSDSQTCRVSVNNAYGGASSRQVVEVDVYYRFDFMLGPLFGPGAPSTCMSSRARSTSQ